MNNNYLNKCYLKRIIFNQLLFLYESKRKKRDSKISSIISKREEKNWFERINYNY